MPDKSLEWEDSRRVKKETLVLCSHGGSHEGRLAIKFKGHSYEIKVWQKGWGYESFLKEDFDFVTAARLVLWLLEHMEKDAYAPNRSRRDAKLFEALMKRLRGNDWKLNHYEQKYMTTYLESNLFKLAKE